MRALLADLSARWWSQIGSLLDLCGDLCARLGCWCFDARQQIDPVPVEPEITDRILVNVMARIAPPEFEPSVYDIAAANLALAHPADALRVRHQGGGLRSGRQSMTGALSFLNDLAQWLGRWVPRLVLVEPTHRGVLFGPRGSARQVGPGLSRVLANHACARAGPGDDPIGAVVLAGAAVPPASSSAWKTPC